MNRSERRRHKPGLKDRKQNPLQIRWPTLRGLRRCFFYDFYVSDIKIKLEEPEATAKIIHIKKGHWKKPGSASWVFSEFLAVLTKNSRLWQFAAVQN